MSQLVFYSVQFGISFVLIGIILTIATCLTLNQMRRSFGGDSVEESRMIRYTLLIFAVSYILRVAEDIVFYKFEANALRNETTFNWIKLTSWVLWDLMPILCLLIIHFNNFNSFRNEEILYCEYSEDGRSSTINSYAGMLFADSKDKEQIIDRDSQYRSQLLTSEAALNSEVELFEESSTDSDEPDDLDRSPVNSLANSLSLGLGLKKSKTTRKKKMKSKQLLSIHPSSINTNDAI